MPLNPQARRPSPRAIVVTSLGLVIAFGPGAIGAQEPSTKDRPAETGRAADRRKAIGLCREHRELEALPILEALAKADPKDPLVLENLAFALIYKSVTVKPEEAPRLIKRARAILLDLKKAGPLSDLASVMVDSLPVDGGLPKHSTRADVDAAVKEGEAAFVRRDMAGARKAYTKAMGLDPRLYHAPLFIGDTYFAEGNLAKARTWFSRAILIDPNREVGHRYLGDALVKLGKSTEARDCYLDAVIAEPYARTCWMTLARWAKANDVTLSHPRIVPEKLDPREGEKKGAEVKGPDDGRSHWALYDQTRKAWANGRFKREFPKEKAYRHSLAEEADALRKVARAVDADIKSGRVAEPHPAFLSLIELDKEGLLEAHVLYARPDDGIAADYEAYRDAHRGELRRYLTRYVAPPKNAGEPPKVASNVIAKGSPGQEHVTFRPDYRDRGRSPFGAMTKQERPGS